MIFFYYLIRGGGFVIAQLPLSFLYKFSDFLAWLTADVVKYRKGVIDLNLKNAFPGKSDKEYDNLRKSFYKNFSDILVESFKLLALNKKLLKKRVSIKNPEVLQELKQRNEGFIAVAGHYNNWEWLGVCMAGVLEMKSMVTYKPLSSVVMDKVMRNVRETLGTDLVNMSNTYRFVMQSKEPTAVLLVADQAPDPRHAYWTKFLNQDTPCFTGPERIARAKNSPLVFFNMQRERRGYYSIEIEILHNHPAESEPGEITELHVKALEKQIMKYPPNWLWSHKRWKHQRP
ncbi:MAG: lysophospholipid acyltransferase family protein [Bacteroidia bacterium]